MADLTKSVKVMLLGEDVNLDKTMRNASRDFDKFSRNVQDATQPLADFGKKAAMTEAALIAMVVGGLAYASKQAADFDSSFREITTLLDDTGQSVDRFRADILDYAQTSTKSIEDINGAIYNAISAGVDYKDALGSLSEAEQLAVATKSGLNAATVTLVSTLNSYGASADEAGDYAEILFETVKNGQTTMDQLSGKLANVTSIAANSGVSFAELSAAIAATTAAGVRTEQSITGLRQTIANIIKPTSQASDMADELGIKFNAQALEAKGLSGILDEVKEATGGNTEQMAQLFGSVEALNVVMALTGEGAEKFESTLRQTEKATGSLADAYGKMADDVKLQAQTLINTIETTMIGVGDRTLAGLEGVPEAASKVFVGIGEAIDSGAFDEIFDAIDGFGDDFRDMLLDIAENAPEALENLDFEGLISSFGNLGESIEEALDALMGGELDLSSAEGLEDFAQRLVDLFAGLTNFTAGFVDGMKPLLRVVGEAAESFAEMDEEGQNFAGSITGMAQSVNTAFKALDSLKTLLISIGGVIGTAFGINQISAALGVLKKIGGVSLGSAGSLASATGLLGFAFLLREVDKRIREMPEIEIGGIKWDLPDEMPANWPFDLGLSAVAERGFERVKGWFNDAAETGEESARQVKDSWYGAIQGITTNPPDMSATEDAVKGVKQQFKDLGLEVDWDKVMEIDADTSKATNKITDLPPMIEKMEVPDFEVPVKIREAEIEKDIAKIEAQADVAQAAFEFRAKVETAEIEKFQTALEEAGATAREAKQATTDMASAWQDTDIGEGRLKLSRMLDERMEMEKESHRLQQEMNKEQLEMMRIRKEQMEEGESAMNITIDDSVEPALRLVMMNILELMQTELNQYADQFLTGINSVTSS